MVDQWSFPTAPGVITVVGAISEAEEMVGAEEMVEAEEEVTVEIEEEVVDEATFEATFEEVVEVVEEGLPENRVPGSLPTQVVRPHHRPKLQRSRMQLLKLWQPRTKKLQVSLVIQHDQDTEHRDGLSSSTPTISS